MAELLPCPFCGGNAMYAKREETKFNHDHKKLTRASRYRIACRHCKCGTGWMFYEEEAVMPWNTRYHGCSDYDQEETIEDCTVQILTNSATGEQSVGWWRGKKEDMPR